MSKPKATSVLGIALDILQIVFALVVIVFTSWKLTNVDVEHLKINTDCLLDGSDHQGPLSGTGFCAYAIAVGLISLLASVIFNCIGKVCKCVTLNACLASKVVEVVGDTALTIWWAVAFAMFVRRGSAANELGWPQRAARDGVIAAAFGGMIAFAADVLVTICIMVLS